MALLRLAMPFAVERYVNRQLNRSHDYGGRVGNIHIQLWRGRYRIDDLKIFKRSGEVRVPLFSTAQMFLSIQWDELFHGSLRGDVRMNKPRLNFVSGPSPQQSQTGADESWTPVLESLFPFQINRLVLTNGEIHFQNDYSKPPVDIYLRALDAVATNLSNSRQISNELPAGVKAHARAMGGGSLDVALQLNPMAQRPTFQVAAQLTNVDLTSLNNFLRAYGKFDVERGQFGLFTSIASKDGNYDGYVKVFFNHLKVFDWEKERGKDALEAFWDAIVGAVTSVFKNPIKDSLATRIPISGSYHDTKIGIMPALGTLLRNAFIRALVPKVDEHVTLADAQKKAVKAKANASAPPPQKGAGKLSARPGTP